MSNSREIVYGKFVEEIKNRFLCRVEINGEDSLCYIPSSCRLSNFFSLMGRTVMLKPIVSPKARTSYAVYAVKIGRSYIPVNLSESNKLIEKNIRKRRFSFLGKRNTVLKEYKIDNYKADLYIQESRTVVEIKGLLCMDTSAVFPSVFSERAVRQLQVIEKLLLEGYKALFIIVSYGPSVETININSTDIAFYDVFKRCVNLGMQYKGYHAKLVRQEIELVNELQISI